MRQRNEIKKIQHSQNFFLRFSGGYREGETQSDISEIYY